MKFVKVMFGTTSGAKSDFEYKLCEVNISDNWNPNANNPKEFGGFNYCDEECILRWLHRGDTIYDVEIPKDAENVKIEGATTIYRTDKIIIKNPRKVTDELALHFYKISNIPEKSYYKALAAVSVMNYRKTAYAIICDKVNKDNVDLVLEEWHDFIEHKDKNDRKNLNELIVEIEELLNEIKSDLLISRFVDKEPYIKKITDDKIINITGESGSGKSYFSNKYINDHNYIVIDTDIVFGEQPSDNKESLEIRKLFKNKDKEDLINDFDNCYNEILDYFKNSNKTIVIDSAQFRNMKDITKLKGKVIVMRTCINKCYERCLKRYDMKKPYATLEEKEKFAKKKKGMFSWYKSLNDFIKK